MGLKHDVSVAQRAGDTQANVIPSARGSLNIVWRTMRFYTRHRGQREKKPCGPTSPVAFMIEKSLAGLMMAACVEHVDKGHIKLALVELVGFETFSN